MEMKSTDNLNAFETIVNNKPFSYKSRMALILLPKEVVYEVLLEEASQHMLQREGVPSAIMERIIKELYETKAWYIPDELKLWDRRYGPLFERPFFTFDDDEDTWAKILQYTLKIGTPEFDEYPNRRIYNRDWEYYAEVIAVAKQNNHPLFETTYHALLEKGLPEKVWMKKQEELKQYHGTEHFCRIKVW